MNKDKDKKIAVKIYQNIIKFSVIFSILSVISTNSMSKRRQTKIDILSNFNYNCKSIVCPAKEYNDRDS